MKAEHKWLVRNQLGPQERHQRGSKQHLKQRHWLLEPLQHPGLPPPAAAPPRKVLGSGASPPKQACPLPAPFLTPPHLPSIPYANLPSRAASPPPLLLPVWSERGIKEFLEKHFSASPEKRKRNFSSVMPLPSRAEPSSTKRFP